VKSLRKPYYSTKLGDLYQGNALEVLREMEPESIQCCITSPPYWGLRDYGHPPIVWGGDKDCVHVWGGEKTKQYSNYNECFNERWGNAAGAKKQENGNYKSVSSGQFCQKCNAWLGNYGLEPTPELYVEHTVEIFREVRRVLRSDGSLFLNLGDSYGTGTKAKRQPGDRGIDDGTQIAQDIPRCGGEAKQLLGIPWRVALALQADGWWLRQDIIWCLSGGTKVYARTQKGDMPTNLKDLYRLKPETVKLWNGIKWTQLKGMSKHPRKGDEIEIVLRSGERISCTPNHKWPTKNGIVKARALKCGDIIEMCYLPQKKSFIRTYVPNEIGWFIGTYLAEGSRDTSKTIQIASHIRESYRFDKLCKIAEQYDGTCRKHITSENGMTICLDGKILNAIIDTYLAGKIAKDKHLSNACWQRSNVFLHYLLEGYLHGDGHWEEGNKRWRVGFTRNYNLESDLRTLCARLGIELTCKLSKSYIGTKKYDSFRGEIRFPRKRLHWNQKDKGEIIEIRKSRARYFYDVGVEDEPHQFALASGVLTHNSKPNPMPESVTDRCTKSHEYIFLMTKAARYYYDAEAIKEPSETKPHSPGWATDVKDRNDRGVDNEANQRTWGNGTRNKRSVWTVPTHSFPGAHFATFPPALILPCILAGTSERGCCPECGAPWERVVEKPKIPEHLYSKTKNPDDGFVHAFGNQGTRRGAGQAVQNWINDNPAKTTGWEPTCKCGGKPVPCTVLDCFLGSGTVALQCEKYGRRWVGIDLGYMDISVPRIEGEARQLKLWG